MKKLVLSLVFLATSLVGLPAFSQIGNEPTALGLPGDNLNLYAVLDVFQKSKTLEEFERTINSKASNINNLDLNNDNAIDYIEVISNKVGDSYSIVLRDAINESQYQDVAVIEVNKNRSGNYDVQIIGDEELYGKNYIVEPDYPETANPGYTGYDNSTNYGSNYGDGVGYVNSWPIISYLFSASFSLYVSPFSWGYYPSYWNPWTPVYYQNYWDYNNRYYNNSPYRRTVYLRNPIRYSDYSSRRRYSEIVTRNRMNGDYDRVYNGKTYRKPDAPDRYANRPMNQDSRSVNQPMSPAVNSGIRSNRSGIQHDKRGNQGINSENHSGDRRQIPSNNTQTAPVNNQGVLAKPTDQGNRSGNRRQMPTNNPQTAPANRQVPTPENKSVTPRENRRQIPTNNQQTAPANQQVPTPENKSVAPRENRRQMPTNNQQTAPVKQQIPTPENRPVAPREDRRQMPPANNPQTAPVKQQVPTPENRPVAPREDRRQMPANNPQTAPAKQQVPMPENRPVAPREDRRQMPANNPQTAPVNRQVPMQQSRPANPPVIRQSPPQNLPAQTSHENNKRNG